MKRNLILLLCFIVMLFSACVKENKKYDLYYDLYFGTQTHVMIISNKIDSKMHEEVYNSIDKILKRLDDTFNAQHVRNNVTTEIMNINNNAGVKETQVSDEVITVLNKAIQMSELSIVAGVALFDVTILPIWEKWDFLNPYSVYLDNRTTVPSGLDDLLHLVNYKNIIINKNNVMLKEKGMKIDLGAIVKGYATDVVKDYLLSVGLNNAVIDVGRNIYVLGSCYEDGVWPAVKLKRPFSDMMSGQDYYYGTVLLDNQTIVTSGTYEKFVKDFDGNMYHHILNPKTGYPIDNNVISVSVITDDSINGDGLSTTLFALGLEKGFELVDTLEGVEVIYVIKNGEKYEIYLSAGLESNFVFNEECSKLGYVVKERK